MTMALARTVGLVVGSALSLQLCAVAESDEFVQPVSATSTAPAPASNSLPDAPSMVAQQQAEQNPASKTTPANSPTPAPQLSQTPPQQPKGAAAAEVQRSTGTAASTPSGAAIAPAKQKRSRSLLIRMGMLAGAGIAIGTVVALSSGSPSKPPGAN
jgi:hypothetical protein